MNHPDGWEIKELKEIGEWHTGNTPRRSNSEYWDGSILWVSPKEMKTERITDTEDKMTEKALEETNSQIIPANSIILVTRSGILEHSLPVAINEEPVTINQDLKAFVPAEGVMTEYLYYYIEANSNDILRECSKDGTTVASINSDSLYSYEIAIPTKEEQKQIVNKIEELLSQLNAGVKQLEEARTRLDQYEKSLQEVAVEGKLTKNWRSNSKTPEPSEKRVDKIEDERYELWVRYEKEKKKRRGENVETDRWKNKYEPPAELSVDGLTELPEGWVWVTLDTITAYDVDYRGKTPPYSDSGIPVISSGNIDNDEIVIEDPKYVSEKTYEEWLTRGVPEPGDLLITTEAPPGNTALFPGDERYLPTRRIITCKTVGVDNRYLQLCFNYSEVEEYIRRNSRGSTVDRILKDALFETPIPLPPLAEQREIVNQIERQYTVIQNTRETINSNLNKGKNMRQAILEKAFDGEMIEFTNSSEAQQASGVKTEAGTKQLRLDDVQ